MTDLPPLPYRIGYDRGRVLRGALIFFLLATVGSVVLAAMQRIRPSALGRLVGAGDGSPVPVLFLVVEGIALVFVLLAVLTAWRRRDFLLLRADGLEFHNHDGVFFVDWQNVAQMQRAPAGYVGITLREPARLLETHQGTPEQRERLATLDPFGSYHLILHPEQLACGVDRFLAWADALRGQSVG